VTTYLARDAQSHQATMVAHMTPYHTSFTQRLSETQHYLMTYFSPPEALQKAYGLLYGTLVKQATLLAYIDNFRLLAILSVLCVPTVLLFKKVKIKNGPIAV
jgi:MFS transporter, DHA2 family, multidrug resistance protein